MPLMSRRLDEDDEEILPARRTAEREMTLGTGAILAIFFGLVVLLGIFFGFGYKLGSSATKSAGSLSAESSAPAAASPSTNFSGYKPAAGSPVGANAGSAGVAVRDSGPLVMTPPTGGGIRASQAPAPATPVSSDTEQASAPLTLASSGTLAASSALAATPAPVTAPGGAFVVQVAAVSHQEDADLLVNALHARGYSVAAHSDAGDRLVHIQVGPFRDKKDADAMRQRLLADGYNAFVK